MGSFMPTESADTLKAAPNALVAVIRPLNSKSKCAMFAAARAGVIARKTWNGCAWNAAGKDEGLNNISSTTAASGAFGVDEYHVSRFIKTWDNLHGVTNKEATAMLITAIEHVGLFTEPGMGRTTRIVKAYAFKSQATKFAEQLDSGELTLEMIPGARQMEQMLSA